MKSLLSFKILLFLFLCKNSYSQTVNFYDNASHRVENFGFSYTVTLSITKIQKGNSSDDNYDFHEVKLIKIVPDSRGYLKNGKYYSLSQLGVECDPIAGAAVVFSYSTSDESLIEGSSVKVGLNKTITTKKGGFYGIKNTIVTTWAGSNACRNKIDKLLTTEKSTINSNQQKAQTKQTTSTTDDFWNEKPTAKKTSSVRSSQTTQKSKQQIEADRKLQESRNRYGEQKDRFFNTMEKQKQEQERKDAILASSFYADEARSRAEQGISENSSFNRRFDDIDELQKAFYQQAQAINDNAQRLSDARLQQNANTKDYLWGNSTGADRAVGELATGVANLIGQAKAERERKEAQEKLRKERDEQRARIEAERKQKILDLRNDIFKQFSEGGVPLTRHNVKTEELYFFTYAYDGKTNAKVSNVFPYAKYKDGTWAFKDKVKAESEKVTGNKVFLVGYYTTKQLAEKERNVFVVLLPKAEVQVTSYTVKGRKWDGTNSSTSDFWGNETKTDNKTKKTSNFWDETPTRTDKNIKTK